MMVFFLHLKCRCLFPLLGCVYVSAGRLLSPSASAHAAAAACNRHQKAHVCFVVSLNRLPVYHFCDINELH